MFLLKNIFSHCKLCTSRTDYLRFFPSVSVLLTIARSLPVFFAELHVSRPPEKEKNLHLHCAPCRSPLPRRPRANRLCQQATFGLPMIALTSSRRLLFMGIRGGSSGGSGEVRVSPTAGNPMKPPRSLLQICGRRMREEEVGGEKRGRKLLLNSILASTAGGRPTPTPPELPMSLRAACEAVSSRSPISSRMRKNEQMRIAR